MRHADTKAITITLPLALYNSVEQLAKRDHCGNVSAVIRNALYKEAGVRRPIAMTAGDGDGIAAAEARTAKYARRPKILNKDGTPLSSDVAFGISAGHAVVAAAVSPDSKLPLAHAPSPSTGEPIARKCEHPPGTVQSPKNQRSPRAPVPEQ